MTGIFRAQGNHGMASQRSSPEPGGTDICPVCQKPIQAKDPVTIDHGDVIHADCLGKPPARRPSGPRS